MGFAAPALLGGLLLASVPLIIHLLNRRKFRVVEWAPMKYLKLTIRTTRRRVRLEQLVLLAIRTLFVVACVLAIARPVIDPDSALGWVGGSSRKSALIVVDDSLSMGYRSGDQSAFDLSKRAAEKLIEVLDADDSVTLLPTSMPDEALIREARVGDLGDLNALFDGFACSEAAPRWASVLDAVERRLSRSPYAIKEVTLVTDLRRSGWGEDVEEASRRLAARSSELRIVDVGSPSTDNVALVSLEAAPGAVLPLLETRFRAKIRNDGRDPFGPVSAELRIGDVVRSITLPRVAAGTTAEFDFSHVFRRAGPRVVTLGLPDDRLPGDNRRWCAVDVRERLDLLLVDGDPQTEAFASEVDFLAAAFTVGDIPWQVYAETDAEWLSDRPSAVDLTVLANLGTYVPERIKQLEKLVREGMGLVIFAGDQIDVPQTNAMLYRDGEGLLPCAIEGVVESEASGLVIDPAEQSPLAALRDIAPEALSDLAPRRHAAVRIEEADRDRCEILARWDDEESSPAVLRRRFGDGQVIFISTSADRDWSDWPVDPTYLLGMRELGLRVSKQGLAGLNRVAGRELMIRLRSGKVADARILPALATEEEALEQVEDESETEGDEPETGQHFVWPKTARAGVYETRWMGEDGETESRPYAVSPDPEESDLSPLDRAELDRWMAALRPKVISYASLDEVLASAGREIWRGLLWAAVALLAMESLLMVWAGRRG